MNVKVPTMKAIKANTMSIWTCHPEGNTEKTAMTKNNASLHVKAMWVNFLISLGSDVIKKNHNTIRLSKYTGDESLEL